MNLRNYPKYILCGTLAGAATYGSLGAVNAVTGASILNDNGWWSGSDNYQTFAAVSGLGNTIVGATVGAIGSFAYIYKKSQSVVERSPVQPRANEFFEDDEGCDCNCECIRCLLGVVGGLATWVGTQTMGGFLGYKLIVPPNFTLNDATVSVAFGSAFMILPTFVIGALITMPCRLWIANMKAPPALEVPENLNPGVVMMPDPGLNQAPEGQELEMIVIDDGMHEAAEVLQTFGMFRQADHEMVRPQLHEEQDEHVNEQQVEGQIHITPPGGF